MYRSSKPKPLSLKCNTKSDKKDEVSTSKNSTTPVARRSLTEDECLSPVQIRCTQDGGDDELDVVWDWNSPQSRIKKNLTKQTKQRKRPLHNISPQVPRKLQTKHNLIPKFASLKAELEKLSHDDAETEEEIVVGLTLEEEQKIIDEDSYLFEQTQIYDDKYLHNVPTFSENFSTGDQNNPPDKSDPTGAIVQQLGCSDLFGDDSFDDELVKCSQQVEEAFVKPKTINLLISDHVNTTIADDSFDAMLEEFTEEDIARFSQEETQPKSPILNSNTPIKTSRTIYRTYSTPVKSDRRDDLPSKFSTPVRRTGGLPRTKSAENCRKLISPESPITCSPDEIEKKRLEAKAKLELRKTQKEIEKKRLEALERLKRNRMQRSGTSKNTSR